MLAHTNEPLIDLHIMGPAERKEEVLISLRALGYKERTEIIPWREGFPVEFRENEGGICLKVTRERRRLTQTALAVMTSIPQPHISEMERGKRPIGKKIAHQLGKALDTDYRVFL